MNTSRGPRADAPSRADRKYFWLTETSAPRAPAADRWRAAKNTPRHKLAIQKRVPAAQDPSGFYGRTTA